MATFDVVEVGTVGHVMPGFPGALVGLRPAARLGEDKRAEAVRGGAGTLVSSVSFGRLR